MCFKEKTNEPSIENQSFSRDQPLYASGILEFETDKLIDKNNDPEILENLKEEKLFKETTKLNLAKSRYTTIIILLLICY